MPWMTSPAFCVIGAGCIERQHAGAEIDRAEVRDAARAAVIETLPLAVERSNPAIWMALAAVIVIEPAAVVGIARLVWKMMLLFACSCTAVAAGRAVKVAAST